MIESVRSRCGFSAARLALVLASFIAAPAFAQVVASDMTNSTSQNLTSFTNLAPTFSSAGDGFQKYRRGVSPTIPFSVLDDSDGSFPPDSLGIINTTNVDEFFGVTDTENSDNSGPVSAVWVFNIAGASDLALSIDMGAMGDFESSDSFTWTYSIDGGPTLPAFTGVTDEDGSLTYTLAGGGAFNLNDPMTVQGENLSNVLQTFSTLISGTGSQLTLTLTAETNGGTEAFAFQNIVISEGGLPIEALAFDMVGSASQRLTSFVDSPAIPFSSPGDGFQKYQRGVSSSIPFSVADDSNGSFPPDSLGIVDATNLDEFFGVTDTVNGDNTGPVTATWTFDISGGVGLGLLIDMGAMGDFESSDSFVWEYSIDGGPVMTAFTGITDEAGSNTYTLAGGAEFTLNDPMTVQGTVLTNVLTQFSTPLVGTGNELVLTLTADTNGGTEAFAFQNIIIGEGFEAPEPPPVLEIYEIQGNGLTSPVAGEVVESRDNVVTAVGPEGFFMQTPASRSDGDVDTSDGIYVFLDATPTVIVGDLVSVVGTVAEFFNLTNFDDDSVVTVTGSGAAVPAPIVFDASTPSADPTTPSCSIEYECYEGMIVTVPNGLVTGPSQRFNSDPIAEAHVVAGGVKAFREPGVEFPGLGMPPIPTWDGNPEVFELDPDKLGLPNQMITEGSTFSATGALGFEFGGYEIWATELTVDPAPVLAPVRDRGRAEFTVGSLNMFRLFDDIDDPADFTSLGDERDDTVVSTEEYDRRRGKFVEYIVNILGAPDILPVQEVEKLGVLEDLAADLAAYDAALVYTAYLEEGNDRGTIDVGYLVRDSVEVDAITQLGKDEILDFDGSLLNDRPPLLLEGRVTGDGSNFPVAVIGVHNRSLGGIDSSSSGERVRAKRLAQAQSLAEKIQALQDANPDVQLVVTGDFNAFEFSDGYVDVMGQITGTIDQSLALVSGPDLVDPDLLNQSAGIEPAQRYSFIFGGSSQILDHALTSMALDMSFRGLEYGRGNADAPGELINDGSTPLRSSDHDGLVLYLTRDRDDDGVFDSLDACPGTSIPEAVPSDDLGKNRWALVDDDFDFETNSPNGKGPKASFSTSDTHGCSCTQIIDELGLGNGHSKFGCSKGVMERWSRDGAP